MLACTAPLLLGTSSLRCVRRRKRFVPFAAAKKDAKSNPRLARILRQYGDDTALAEQQEELDEYKQQRHLQRDASAAAAADSGRRRRTALGGAVAIAKESVAEGVLAEQPPEVTSMELKKQLVFRWDPERK